MLTVPGHRNLLTVHHHAQRLSPEDPLQRPRARLDPRGRVPPQVVLLWYTRRARNLRAV